MDKSLEKNLISKIQSELGKALEKHGYEHTKPSFYVKKNGDWYQVIHLHKFSYASLFRVHIALRHISDSFEAIALNGPGSETYKEYKITFSDNLESVQLCVGEMLKFIEDIGFVWFQNILALTGDNIVKKLRITLENKADTQHQTKKLLGVSA